MARDAQVPASITSADVARLAGVSRATVSFVLNDTQGHRVSAGTRDRVLEAPAAWGTYRTPRPAPCAPAAATSS